MNLRYLKNSLMAFAVTFFVSMSVIAEVIYEENFDGPIEMVEYWPIFGAPNLEADWLTIYNNIGESPTVAHRGEGGLTIHTEDKESGVITYVSDDYNFFDREITYTFEGVEIEALGKSRMTHQWAKFGVVSRGRKLSWWHRSSIIISYSGAGSFQFSVRQLNIGNGYDTAPRKDFISRTFNFDVAFLRKIELTVNSTHYRVAFVFENEMDQLTFGGLHYLDRDRWIETNPIPGVATVTGRSALLMLAHSDAWLTRRIASPDEILEDENGQLGVKLTIGSVKVEATSRFEGL